MSSPEKKKVRFVTNDALICKWWHSVQLLGELSLQNRTNKSSVQGAERKIRDEEKKQLRKKVKGQTVGGHGQDGKSSVNQTEYLFLNY